MFTRVEVYVEDAMYTGDDLKIAYPPKEARYFAEWGDTWSTGKPTVPGWYWVRTDVESFPLMWDGKEWTNTDTLYAEWKPTDEWYGPITPP